MIPSRLFPLTRRELLTAALASGAAAFLPARARGAASKPKFDAALSRDGAPVQGAPGYPTLAAAMAAAPPGEAPFRVFIPTGTWREHNRIRRPNIQLIGASRAASILVFDDLANVPHPPGEPASTLVVEAPDFRAAHLTIDNDFDYPHHMPADVAHDRTGASGAQARAVQLMAGADRSVFEDVAMNGWQDTLFTDAGRSYFSNCLVSGAVDFIYGGGVVVFDHCEIRSRTRPGKDFHGFIVAPSTSASQRFGINFLDCRLTKDADMPARTVALGRPWRRGVTRADGKYGDPDAVAQSAFLRCWMDDHIVPEGWYPMHYNNKAGERVMLQPEEVRFGEFGSTGPGAGSATPRRRFLTAKEAREFTLRTIFPEWKL
ncbi:MAG: pectinesterase family protein [Pseudomonadota bacterium]